MKIGDILSGIYNLVKSANPAVALVVTLGALAMSYAEFSEQAFGSIFSKADLLLVEGLGGQLDFSVLRLINYCVPLDYFLSLVGSYLGLAATCAGIRIIKSFVPTVS